MKKTLKLLSLLLAIAMVFSLTGCMEGIFDEETTEAKEELPAGTVVLDKASVVVGALFVSPVAYDEVEGETAPEVDAEVAAHWSGIQYMKNELGLSDEQLVVADEPLSTDRTAAVAVNELLEAECSIIFATDSVFSDAVKAAAAENIDVAFLVCSSDGAATDNVGCFNARGYEAQYLCGIAAGMKAAALGSTKLGFVAESDRDDPACTADVNAFAVGARSVCPGATVTVADFDDGVKEAVGELAAAGCAAIGQSGYSAELAAAADAAKLYFCGYGFDASAQSPNYFLCAPIFNWGVYYYNAAFSIINGRWNAQSSYNGLDIALVSLTTVFSDAADKVLAERTAIACGEKSVFNGPLTSETGAPILPAGETLSDVQLLKGIGCYVEGVNVYGSQNILSTATDLVP